jgi:hypothetical protein
VGWGYPAKEINEQGKTPNPDEAQGLRIKYKLMKIQ